MGEGGEEVTLHQPRGRESSPGREKWASLPRKKHAQKLILYCGRKKGRDASSTRKTQVQGGGKATPLIAS